MDLLADLNEPQTRAVTHVEGPILVLAGAGSGKTRVITRRVAYLVDQGIPPWHILAITFTNKAAGEMRERVEALGVGHGATVCTFHSLCARLLRENAEAAGLGASYSIYDRDDQIRAVKEAMKRADLSIDRLAPAAVLSTISNAKNEMLTAQAYAEKAGDLFQRNTAAVFTEYEKVLAGNNAVDFDDLLTRTAFLLRDRPDIRRQLGERYRYILIDEYQDTNHAQYIIAHGIGMDHENICATGDPDQSIYAWRGADIRNILEFETDYPNARVVHLEENYRSTTPILTTASRLIAHNTGRKEKTLWTQRPGGTPVTILHCDDEHAEAGSIVERIASRKADGNSHDDVAVFYRVNSLSRVMEEALIRAGVPYRIARGVAFYNRAEIRDVLAYLRLLINPADDLSCRRVINTPARGIGATTVNRLAEAAERTGRSLLEVCHDPASAGLKA
ncbi:MAG: ATP-dependent helicase, partial [Planctomycetota bacterium]